MQITQSDMSANEYETYYYTDQIAYNYEDQPVEFISESQIKVGDTTYDLRNKKT